MRDTSKLQIKPEIIESTQPMQSSIKGGNSTGVDISKPHCIYPTGSTLVSSSGPGLNHMTIHGGPARQSATARLILRYFFDPVCASGWGATARSDFSLKDRMRAPF